MPIEQIITITSNVSDCGGSGTDTIAVPVSVNIDGTVVAVNGVPCNAPVQPNPIISLDEKNNAIITETGNCPDPNTILYGYTIKDANNNVLFDKTGAASLADITNTVANLVSDLETIIDGSPCPQTQSYVEVTTDLLDSVSSGSDIIATNIDLTDPNNVSDLQQDIKTYIAANGGNYYDTVNVSFDGVKLTITIISSVAGFSLVGNRTTVAFDETAAGNIPCIGCYDATVYATPCDGSGDATIEGNFISVSIVPLLHDGGDVYYLDGTPVIISSPFSGNQLGQGVSGNDVIALLNGDTNKPAGLQFIDTTSDANNTGSFVIAVGDACLNAAFIGVEPVQLLPTLISQTGGQILTSDTGTTPTDGTVEYNFGYSNDGGASWTDAGWQVLTASDPTHDFGAVVFSNGDLVRTCLRYTGVPTSEVCDVRRIPTVIVAESINGNGDYIKDIINTTPDQSSLYTRTDFTEKLTITGHNTANGVYDVEITDTVVNSVPPLPAGLSFTRIDNETIQFVATAAFLADNVSGTVTIDETDIYATHAYDDDASIQSVNPASETYTFTAATGYDCFDFRPTNSMFDRWRINSSGLDILFPSGAVDRDSVMTEMQATLPQPNIIAIDSSPFTAKYIAVSTNAGTVSTIEVYNTTTSAWEVFTPAYTNQGSPCV
jgi:hypothetical protein